VLGEARLPAAPRSVFDYLSQKDRDRLKNMAAGVTTPASAAPIVVKEEIAITIAPTDARTAQAALRGFQPFTADPVKQSRYTSYLLSQSKPTEFNPPELKMGQAIDDFNKELEDYAKAALIFKPVSGAMANRFTSATVMDLGPTVQEGLHTPMPTNMVPAAPEDKKEEPIETPKANAARLGMYGPLTREVEDWFPARLLCKRFGVKDPHPDGQAVDSSAPALDTSSAMAGIQFQSAPSASTSHAADQTLAIDSAVGLSTKPRNRKDISNIGLGDDDDQGRDTLTYERPDRDIFKAIFASDEEDSDEEDDQPDVKEDGKENEDAPLQQLVPSTSGSSLEVQRLNAEASTSIPYNPKATAPKVIDTSFRPTFVSKAEREGRGGRGKEKEAKDGSSTKRDNKSSKKKTGPSALVSFGMDVEEVDERIENGRKRAREKDKEKEKREKKKRKEEKVDDDEDMWVEKPPPPGLANIGNARHPNTSPEDPMDSSMGPARGRKRAVDFL
jgi:G patch domain-containing protein 1